jgi:hypothetical protein
VVAAKGEVGCDDGGALAPGLRDGRGDHWSEIVGEGNMNLNEWVKKDFRRGGSYPPPEVRHG